MIIGIVVAAVVLLVAIGGIVMVLNRGGDQPTTTITPSAPADPTEEPAPDPSPSEEGPADGPEEPKETEPSEPSSDAIDMGDGFSLTPAKGWKETDTKVNEGMAQVSNGTDGFTAQQTVLDGPASAAEVLENFHNQIAEGGSKAQIGEPEEVDLGGNGVEGAIATSAVVMSGSQGSYVMIFMTLVAVRESDNQIALGTIYLTEDSDTDQLNSDFNDMMNSVLKGF